MTDDTATGPRKQGRRPDRTSSPRPAGGGGGRDRGAPPPPPGYAVRALATDLVLGVMRGDLLDGLLDDGPLARRFARLEPKDRALTRAIVGTTLRRHDQISHALSRLMDRPLPAKASAMKAILDVAAAQILFMDVPDHAAVALAVEQAGASPATAKWKGLANAVLRRLTREGAAITADQDAAALDAPAWMMARWTAAYGDEAARAIASAHLVEPSLDLTVKSDAAGWAERLGARLLPTGSLRLASAGAVEALPGYREGAWWVQDAAAALPPRLLGDVRGQRVLDLCAAPGGKTALLAARGATVTALDQSERRLARLVANLDRLGLAATTVVADAATWSADPFDAVLLDAPCSATGTLRRHPDGAFLKSADDVAAMAGLQRAILAHAVDLVRPGGLLVYCTCSLEPEEGEAQIERLLASGAPVERVPVRAEEIGGLAEAVTPAGDMRTLPFMLADEDPRLSGLDGFFAARLVRR